MVEPYLLPVDSDDDDVQFVSENRPGPSHTVDLSKSIFELINDEFVNDIHLNGNSTNSNPVALNNNAIQSLPRSTIPTGEHNTNIALTNPFSQTLPQITVANFAKENVQNTCSNGNGNITSDSIFHGLHWLNDTNPVNNVFRNGVSELPNTAQVAAAPTISTENDWNWTDIFGVMTLPNQTLPATNNPQPSPSTPTFDFHLPYADVTNNVPAQIATNNKPKMDHQIHNTLPTPLPNIPQQYLNNITVQATSTITANDWNWGDIFEGMNIPNQTLPATNNPQPGTSTSTFDLNLPHADVINSNTSSRIAVNNEPKIDHQIYNSFALPTPLPYIPQQNQPGPSRLAYQQPKQQNGISEPPQLANFPTQLPFIPQPGPSRLAFQPRQQVEYPEPVPLVSKLRTPLPFIPQENQPGPSVEISQNRQLPPHQAKLPTPLPFVPQQNQSRQQVEIPEYVPAPPQQAKLPIPFVPQPNQPGPSSLAHQPKEENMDRLDVASLYQQTNKKLDIASFYQQTNDYVFRPYDMHPAQNHTPINGNIKRKHTDLIPIKVVRSTKQYETLVEMGFLKKDIGTALRKCNLDLYETIEYLSEPKRAAKRQKKEDNAHSQFNAEITNQIQQSIEEPIEEKVVPRKPANLYEELLYLEETGGIVKSIESFDCEICMETIEIKDGMILRNCLHRYCKDCLNGTIVHSEEIEIKCPYITCEETLQDREIRAVLSKEEYEKYLMKCVRVAQVTISGTILCNLPDCDGWCICEDIVNEFKCPQCKNINCIPCKAIHPGRDCREYQDDLAAGDANGIISGERRSEQAIQELIKNNEAMQCFKCGILIMKRDGCDYIQCVMCKSGICWATRGPRYGPGGIGDRSGGCGCTLKNRCHKDCRGCH